MTKKKPKPSGPHPVVCRGCGQRGDEPPGFVRVPYPEAVGVNEPDGMILVDSFKCQTCGQLLVVAAGTIEVRARA